MRDNPAYERETITVGPSNADITGSDGRAIQSALDGVAMRGGGTVRAGKGEYMLPDSIYLRPDVALVGDAGATLRRGELAASDLAVDVDVGQFEFTPTDASLFRPGMGVRFYDEDRGWAVQPLQLTVTAVRDGRVLLGEMNICDRLAAGGGRVVNYFPMIYGHRADRAMVENFSIDATVDDDGELDGMRSAAVCLYRSPDCTLRGLTVSGSRGDAICFSKASVRTLVEDCDTFGNTHHGIHPGSHSAHCTVRKCHIHHNGSDGLYICWGIHHSTFEANVIHDNGRRFWRSGICIGHKDTDNVLARNHVHDNCKYGICVRRKTAANGAHRNVYRENIIENNGQDPAGIPPAIRELIGGEPASCGVLIMGVTRGSILERNVIRETRDDARRFQRHAVILAEGVSGVKMIDNAISGHPDTDVVDESGATDNELQ